MNIWLRYSICCCWLMMTFSLVHGQDKDSTKKKLSVSSLAKDLYHSFVVVEHKEHDSSFFQKSEASFMPYAGKAIRYIYINNLSFSENVLDTSRNFMSAIARFADRLQSNTRDYTVRQMLFVKRGQLVDPYRLADNERFLRDQSFIKDARIWVITVSGAEDSVDLFVRVRDVFSWGAEIKTSGVSNFQASVYDANFLGMAQRLDYTLLYDYRRNPTIGSGGQYRKISLGGSFINLSAGYSNINQGILSLGTENETSWYLQLDRPLYTPNARFAGGLQLSANRSANVFGKPTNEFIDYKYQLADVWLGYNFGVYKQKPHGEDNRRRRFVSLRYFDQHFDQLPKLAVFDPRYANKRYLLGQVTWYKINFYSTNYIYGFGRTEDMPVGITHKATLGPVQVDSLRRWYLGWEFDHLLVDGKENYWNYTFAVGTNLYKRQWQDNSALLNISWYSRLFSFPKFKLRQFANISYSAIYNQHVYQPLYINNEFGLDNFNTDSVRGTQRISLGTESSLFTRWSILGFKIGFFAFGRSTFVTPQQTGVFSGGFFPAMGGGIRTRNENLIFGTIECRFSWFPRTLYNVNNISFTVSSNLRVRYTGSFVQPPWFALVK